MPAQTVLEIEKVLNGEYWVNRYFLSTSLGDSASAAADILEVERDIHYTPITFTKMSMRTVAEGDFDYVTAVLNVPGLNSIGAGDTVLPLFNVVRVDLGAATGRPSRKYYRGCLTKAGISGMDIASATLTALLSATAPLPSVAALCDPQGTDLVSRAVFPLVAMRQLRRGSKKKSTP